MTTENYKIIREKIEAENTIDGLWKLEKSATNLYNNGCLDANQLGILDVLIMEKMTFASKYRIEEVFINNGYNGGIK